MPIQRINYGSAPDDGTGDTLRVAFRKADDNFVDLDNRKAEQTDVADALAGKVDKVAGKGLSTNDYTTAEKNQLATVSSGKFAAGTVAAPSLRGTADENTGLRFAGNDILQLITGGVVRLQIAADGTPSGVFTEKLPVSTATQSAIDSLAAACVAIANVGSAPNEIPSNQHLGELAFLDTLGATSVTRHTRDSKPGDVWHEYVSNTQLIKKFHGFDNVIRTITETYA